MSEYTWSQDNDGYGDYTWAVFKDGEWITSCDCEASATDIIAILEEHEQDKEELRKELAAAQADLEAERKKDRLSKLDYVLYEQAKAENAKLRAHIERIAELEAENARLKAHIERVEKARNWWKNKSLYSVDPNDNPASETVTHAELVESGFTNIEITIDGEGNVSSETEQGSE